MMNTEAIRNVVGIIGNVISFGLFLSPASTIWGIRKKKDVEEFVPTPYIATVMNCLLWIFYGLPIVHPDSTLVITINSVGLLMELLYLSAFLRYGNNGHRKKIAGLLAVEVIGIGGIAAITLPVFHTFKSRSFFVGIFCVIFGIGMYASPLTVMWTVIKTKSVEFMPFYLSLASFLNGSIWTAYALLKFDLFILIANGVGALLGLAQLILYGIYWRTTPKKNKTNEKPSGVQLQNVV